jgi:DNA-binding protein H-NS
VSGYDLDVLTTIELLDLRDYANRLIQQRIKKERSEIERTLARISEATDEGHPSGRRGLSLKGTKVQAKYKDPQSGQTWSGRGAHPRWLKPLLQQGRKLEDFAIGAPVESKSGAGSSKASRKRNSKARRAKKTVAAKRVSRTTRKSGSARKRKAS